MLGADPWGVAILLGLLAAPFGAIGVREGLRVRGAALAAGLAAAAAFVGTQYLGWPFPPPALAALVGACAALAIPGLPIGMLRPKSFGSAYPRGAFAGSFGTTALSARVLDERPSRLLDAADRLKLESALVEIEREHGVAIAVALVARAGEAEGAHGRAALYGAALALAAAAASGASAVAGFGAAALGALAGRALARSGRFRRLFVAESVLAELHLQAASDAFAHAGLAEAAGDRGLLIFASLFEGRASALAGRGLWNHGPHDPYLAAVAQNAALGGIDVHRALVGFIAAAEEVSELAPRGPDEPVRGRPHPVRVED